MKSDNIVLDKSFNFAVRIVKLYKYLRYTIDERVLSTQVLKSGTSIGANIREALRSSSRKEFIVKMNISLKEAYETEYWLELFVKSDILNREAAIELYNQCGTIRRVLIASINTEPLSSFKLYLPTSNRIDQQPTPCSGGNGNSKGNPYRFIGVGNYDCAIRSFTKCRVYQDGSERLEGGCV